MYYPNVTHLNTFDETLDVIIGGIAGYLNMMSLNSYLSPDEPEVPIGGVAGYLNMMSLNTFLDPPSPPVPPVTRRYCVSLPHGCIILATQPLVSDGT